MCFYYQEQPPLYNEQPLAKSLGYEAFVKLYKSPEKRVLIKVGPLQTSRSNGGITDFIEVCIIEEVGHSQQLRAEGRDARNIDYLWRNGRSIVQADIDDRKRGLNL